MEVAERGAFAQAALSHCFERTQLAQDERALATELTLGVLRHRTQLIARLNTLLHQPLRELPSVVQAALLIGAYQLVHLRMPAHSAVDQAVALVPRHLGALVGVANAVLRRLSRAQQPEGVALSDCAAPEALAEAANQPLFYLAEMWQRLGRAQVIALAEAQNERPALHLRVHTERIARAQLLTLLRERGLDAQPHPLIDVAITVRGTGAIVHLPGFDQGLFAVQDAAAMAVSLLALGTNATRALDLCAAPGGKSMHLAALLNASGHVFACDVHAGRTRRIADSARRLGLSERITPIVCDGRDLASIRRAIGHNTSSLVLLDAPCSGLGTLRRHPELRTRARAQQEPIVMLQAELLRSAAQLTAVGGRLIYSVCTPLLAEGREQIASFLAAHPQFAPLALKDIAPVLAPLSSDGIHLETWPHIHGMDGFFAVALEHVGKRAQMLSRGVRGP